MKKGPQCTDTTEGGGGSGKKEEERREAETSPPSTQHPTSAGAARSAPSQPPPPAARSPQDNESAPLSSIPPALPPPIPDVDWSDSEGEDEEDEGRYPYRVPTSKRYEEVLREPSGSKGRGAVSVSCSCPGRLSSVWTCASLGTQSIGGINAFHAREPLSFLQ